MSIVTSKRVIGAFSVLLLIWLFPAVASAAVPTIYAPGSVIAGSSTPFYVLAVPGADVSVSITGSATPATAVANGSGYASFTLNAPTTTGVLTITADSSGNQSTANVQVKADVPSRLDILSQPGLLPASNYYTYTLSVRAVDQNDNGCSGWPINITVDGIRHTVTASADGKASFVIGPSPGMHTYSVIAEANGHSGNVSVRFMEANLYLSGYNETVPAGKEVTITALLRDGDLTSVPGILLTFDVDSPDGLATPSSFSGYTDPNGRVSFTFKTSPTTGLNTVTVGNQSLGSNLRSARIRGIGGQVSQITLTTTSPVLADGSTSCLLRVWAKDSMGNPASNEELTVVRNYVESYPITTNINGFYELDVGASQYVGDVRFDVTSASGVTNSINATYMAGPPARTVIKAMPNVIASSEVPNPPDKSDVHMTDIIAEVTDQWYHPLKGYSITVLSTNPTAGTIVGPASGVTDDNGAFYTQFRLGDHSNGTGTVDVRAVSGTFFSTCQITYTNVSFLSVDTSITPRNVSVNGTINVGITIKGVGWNSRQPVDLMLITDRSGSMDWYANIIDGPYYDTTTSSGKEFPVGTFYNPVKRNLQFMVSSPYTNYDDGSYYYGLKIVGPGGTKYGTQSANENYYIYTNAPVGTYTIYAKAQYSAGGGRPSYSYAVLTTPKRLGSAGLDLDSAAKVAATQLVNNMTNADQIGLASFNTQATLNAGLKNVVTSTTNKTNLIKAINNLDANGGTYPSTGIEKALQEFSSHGRSTAKQVAILLSDGYSQSPANDIAQAVAAKNKGVIIYTIGMGMADNATLEAIAHTTGGEYYRATSSQELADLYQQIFRNVSEVIATQSELNLISERSIVNGTLMNDTEYVPGTAQVYFTNGGKAQIEPVITWDDSRYTLSWEPGAINCNQIWKVEYQLKAMHGGLITPISNKSSLWFSKADGSTETVHLVGDSIYCQGTLDGGFNGSLKTLDVDIDTPENGLVTNELRMLISWHVHYAANGTYSQTVSIIPARKPVSPEEEPGVPVGGSTWMEIGRGYSGNRSTEGTYSFWWNIERVPKGSYLVRVFADDGTYTDEEMRFFTISFDSGSITLQ